MISVRGSIRRWLRKRQEASALAALRRERIGANAHVDPSVQVLGWRQVRIGDYTVVGEGGWLNVNDRESDELAISIGSHCFIGRRNFFSSGTRIRIGDYCLTGIDCHFLGSDHVNTDPFKPYILTGTTPGSIEVGTNCWLGASVTVLKNVKIGYGSIIGAGSVVGRDVPPLSVAVGNPCRIVKRFDLGRRIWVRTDERQDETPLPTEAEYTAALRREFPKLRGPAIAASGSLGDL